jgi:prephenate dehydrogenase
VKRVADRLLVAGVGLIGGSLALALKRRGLVGEVVGLGRSRRNLEVARARGIIDRAERDPRRAARDVDLVVVAVPVRSIAPVIEALAPVLPPTAVITDAGSVKAPVVREVERVLGKTASRFCGAHPIAGTEDSGAAAALPDLLDEERCILTPTRTTSRAALRRVRALWEAAGMRVEALPPDEHDAIFALVSHLPHVAAFALVGAVAAAHRAPRALAYAAGGFRDGTRVAGSSPEMWTDIFLANRTAVLAALDRFGRATAELRAAIRAGDRRRLAAVLTRARQVRRRLAPPRARDRTAPKRRRAR